MIIRLGDGDPGKSIYVYAGYSIDNRISPIDNSVCDMYKPYRVDCSIYIYIYIYMHTICLTKRHTSHKYKETTKLLLLTAIFHTNNFQTKHI